MPLYLIERSFADQLELTDDDVRLIEDVNADEGVRWPFSFLSADRRRSYCLYEAPSPDEIVAAARRANVPVDEIVEVDRFVPDVAGLAGVGRRRGQTPNGSATELQRAAFGVRPRCEPARACGPIRRLDRS